jgi:hypothetical protein
MEKEVKLVAVTSISYDIDKDAVTLDGPTLRGPEVEMLRQYTLNVVLRKPPKINDHNVMIVIKGLTGSAVGAYFLATIEGLWL